MPRIRIKTGRRLQQLLDEFPIIWRPHQRRLQKQAHNARNGTHSDVFYFSSDALSSFTSEPIPSNCSANERQRNNNTNYGDGQEQGHTFEKLRLLHRQPRQSVQYYDRQAIQKWAHEQSQTQSTPAVALPCVPYDYRAGERSGATTMNGSRESGVSGLTAVRGSGEDWDEKSLKRRKSGNTLNDGDHKRRLTRELCPGSPSSRNQLERNNTANPKTADLGETATEWL